MSGFHRQGQPAAFDRAAVRAVVINFIGEREIATLLREQDPFGIDHDCLNPAGHDFIGACGEVVCVHCGRIAWR
jgi:hypothetical protein